MAGRPKLTIENKKNYNARKQHKWLHGENALEYQQFNTRLYRGWTIEKAIDTPKKKIGKPPKVKYDKAVETMYEQHVAHCHLWEKKPVSKKRFYKRLKDFGWSPQKAIHRFGLGDI